MQKELHILNYVFIRASICSNFFQVHLKMASEASRRAEDDRMRRLRLQEEQDLAYAIALSKAEAASLKTTSTAS